MNKLLAVFTATYLYLFAVLIGTYLVLILVLFAHGAEPPPQPASTEVLIERKMRIEAQLQSLSYALREINEELEKRSKAPQPSPQKAPEKK